MTHYDCGSLSLDLTERRKRAKRLGSGFQVLAQSLLHGLRSIRFFGC